VGYTDTTVWLIVVAIMMSLGFRKSGLAKCIGLILIKAFGKSSLNKTKHILINVPKK